jgi:hypothetical protein
MQRQPLGVGQVVALVVGDQVDDRAFRQRRRLIKDEAPILDARAVGSPLYCKVLRGKRQPHPRVPRESSAFYPLCRTDAQAAAQHSCRYRWLRAPATT